MPRVFISYRREDSQDISRRIYDRLEAQFGKTSVLIMDVGSIPPGADFQQEASRLIATCDVVLAVIGLQWAGEASAPVGQRWLDSPQDSVRIEIEAALAREIAIIPLLVSGAEMPTLAILPASLQSLAYRNALLVRSDEGFGYDLDRVIASIEQYARSVRPSSLVQPSSPAWNQAPYAPNWRREVPTPWWKSLWVIIGSPIVAVLLIVAGFSLLALPGIATQGPVLSGNAAQRQPVPADVMKGVTTVTTHTFATVDTGEVANPLTATGGSSQNPAVMILRDSAGKPIVLYIGAEYCPYCAAERWAMVIALNRFGSFSNLHISSSSSTDVYPNTPTFTFYNSSYASQYIDFQPVELEDRNQVPLQSMTAAQSKLFSTYNHVGSIPFMDFGNQYIAIGASYSNDVLTDQNWHTIAQQLNDPSSLVTQSIVGTANYMTAAICQITGNKPANVCTAAPIPAMEKTIGKPAGG